MLEIKERTAKSTLRIYKNNIFSWSRRVAYTVGTPNYEV